MLSQTLVLQLRPTICSNTQIAEFFYHQYLWKELLNNSIILHEDDHKRKAASQTTTFG